MKFIIEVGCWSPKLKVVFEVDNQRRFSLKFVVIAWNSSHGRSHQSWLSLDLLSEMITGSKLVVGGGRAKVI